MLVEPTAKSVNCRAPRSRPSECLGTRGRGVPRPRGACTRRLRLTAFITNTRGGQLADLELRHRRGAHCEDRTRIGKDTGLTNLPLHGYTHEAAEEFRHECRCPP